VLFGVLAACPQAAALHADMLRLQSVRINHQTAPLLLPAQLEVLLEHAPRYASTLDVTLA